MCACMCVCFFATLRVFLCQCVSLSCYLWAVLSLSVWVCFVMLFVNVKRPSCVD